MFKLKIFPPQKKIVEKKMYNQKTIFNLDKISIKQISPRKKNFQKIIFAEINFCHKILLTKINFSRKEISLKKIVKKNFTEN